MLDWCLFSSFLISASSRLFFQCFQIVPRFFGFRKTLLSRRSAYFQAKSLVIQWCLLLSSVFPLCEYLTSTLVDDMHSHCSCTFSYIWREKFTVWHECFIHSSQNAIFGARSATRPNWETTPLISNILCINVSMLNLNSLFYGHYEKETKRLLFSAWADQHLMLLRSGFGGIFHRY